DLSAAGRLGHRAASLVRALDRHGFRSPRRLLDDLDVSHAGAELDGYGRDAEGAYARDERPLPMGPAPVLWLGGLRFRGCNTFVRELARALERRCRADAARAQDQD